MSRALYAESSVLQQENCYVCRYSIPRNGAENCIRDCQSSLWTLLLWMFKEIWVLSLLPLISMHWPPSAFVSAEGELSCRYGEIAHWSITALREKNSSSRLSHDSIDLLKGTHQRPIWKASADSRSMIHTHILLLIGSAYITDPKCIQWGMLKQFLLEVLVRIYERELWVKLRIAMGWLAGVVHVGQFLEAWSPIIKVVVILVLVWARWGEGTQAACQRTSSFIVVD